MIIDGFALIDTYTGEELAWWRKIPPRVDVPGTRITVHGAGAEWEYAGYRIEARQKELPDPEVRPRQIDKALVLERLTDGQLEAALAAMTPRQKERWRMPGRPRINVDDAELLAMLAHVGADPAVVLAEEGG